MITILLLTKYFHVSYQMIAKTMFVSEAEAVRQATSFLEESQYVRKFSKTVHLSKRKIKNRIFCKPLIGKLNKTDKMNNLI